MWWSVKGGKDLFCNNAKNLFHKTELLSGFFHLFRWLLTDFRSGIVGLDLAGQVEALPLVEDLNRVEPVTESRQRLDVVGVRRALKKFDLEEK